MNVLIRKAVAGDVEALTELSNQLGYRLSQTATSQNLNLIAKNDYEIVLIAIHEEKIVGWVHVFQTTRLESGSFCELGGMVVSDQYRRRGIGKLLLEKVKAWCLDRQTPDLRVRSNVKRTAAHAFYLASGFAELKQQKVFGLTLPLF